MSRLRTATMALLLATSVYAQVLAGSDDDVTSTVAQTASDVDDSDDQSSATAFSVYEEAVATATAIATAVATTSASASASAQVTGSVVSIYFPGADQLPYVASLIGQDSNAQTLAISCGPGVDTDTCGFPSSVTVTAGPSTAFVSVSNGEATFIYDCKISASTTALCAETFNGEAAYIATISGSGALTGSTSSVLTETLGSTDITWMPITITAGVTSTTNTAAASVTSAASQTLQATAAATSAAGDDSWSNLSNLNSGSSTTGVGSTASTSQATVSSSTTTGANNYTAAWSVSSVTPAQYTGAASQRLVIVGNVVAGLLALAGMAM